MPENRAIDCRTAVSRLWDYLDQELDDTRMDEVRQHLADCKDCLSHADFDQRFLQALEHARDRQLLPPAVRSHVMAALTAAGFSTD